MKKIIIIWNWEKILQCSFCGNLPKTWVQAISSSYLNLFAFVFCLLITIFTHLLFALQAFKLKRKRTVAFKDKIRRYRRFHCAGVCVEMAVFCLLTHPVIIILLKHKPMGAVQSCYSFRSILSPGERSHRTALVNCLVLLVPVSLRYTQPSVLCRCYYWLWDRTWPRTRYSTRVTRGSSFSILPQTSSFITPPCSHPLTHNHTRFVSCLLYRQLMLGSFLKNDRSRPLTMKKLKCC